MIINWWRRDGQAIAVSGDYSAVTSVIARAEDSSTIAFDSAKAATRDWTARSSTARGSPRQTSWMRARASSERGCPCARRSEGGARHSRPSRSLPSRSWHSVGRERRRRFAPGDPDLKEPTKSGSGLGASAGAGLAPVCSPRTISSLTRREGLLPRRTMQAKASDVAEIRENWHAR